VELVKAAVAGTEHYERFLRESLYRIAGIRHTRSTFALRALKRAISVDAPDGLNRLCLVYALLTGLGPFAREWSQATPLDTAAWIVCGSAVTSSRHTKQHT
jgi:hypothetical protein